MISLIFARSLNRCIGDNGDVPWRLPDEFSHFENTTRGKPIIMGRKTYEDHKSLLPGRLNIVISTQQNYQTVDGVVLVHSLQEAIVLAQAVSEDIFIIGGVSLFVAALPIASVVYETIVEAEVAGDTVLPAMDFGAWDSELLQAHPVDARHKFAFKVYRHSRSRRSPL
jgi:dihydrofolate reductase